MIILRGFRQATSPWIEPVIGMAHLPLRLSSGVSDTFQTFVDRGERVTHWKQKTSSSERWHQEWQDW